MRFRARHITTGRQEKNDLHFPDSVWKICEFIIMVALCSVTTS